MIADWMRRGMGQEMQFYGA